MQMACESFCKAPTNTYRLCPPPCDGFCPPYCRLFQFGLPLSPPPPPILMPHAHRIHALSLALTISLSVLATAFFLFICYTIYRFCSYWRRSPQSRRPPGPNDFVDEEHGPIVDHPIWYIRTIGLQPSVISAITVVKYKRGDGLIEGTDCAVCLNEFEEDETLRLLPKCNHAFHIPCVDTWLTSHTNCPMCRAGIVNHTPASLPSQELVVQNSGPAVEENQLEEIRRDSDTEPPELRPGPRIEDHGISQSQSGLKFNEDARVLDGVQVQPMRRSVSMDSLSASMISAVIASAFPRQSNTNSDNQLDEAKESSVEDIAGLNRSFPKFMGSPSMESAGSSTVKRSVSCSEGIGFKA